MPGVKGVTGRPHKSGTVLAQQMTRRGLHVYDVSAAMKCSHRTVYDCLSRTRIIRPLELAALCRLFRCGPSDMVDADGLLKEVNGA